MKATSSYSAKSVASNGGDLVGVLFGTPFHGLRFYCSGLGDLLGPLGGYWGSGRCGDGRFICTRSRLSSRLRTLAIVVAICYALLFTSRAGVDGHVKVGIHSLAFARRATQPATYNDQVHAVTFWAIDVKRRARRRGADSRGVAAAHPLGAASETTSPDC